MRSDSGQPFLEVSAEPTAALNRIREVLLIWPGAPDTDQLQAEAQEPAAAEAGARPGPGPESAASPDPEVEVPTPAAAPDAVPEAPEVSGEPLAEALE